MKLDIIPAGDGSNRGEDSGQDRTRYSQEPRIPRFLKRPSGSNTIPAHAGRFLDSTGDRKGENVCARPIDRLRSPN